MKKEINLDKIWDVVVIGAGPAGMMAAARAAERSKQVLLLEKNTTIGKKLLITGGGRCNLTNNKDMQALVASYKHKPKALFSLFSQFGSESTIDFFNSRGMPTKVENEDRVFPVSDSSKSVLEVLESYLTSTNVTILTGITVKKLSVQDSTKLFKINYFGTSVLSKACIISTGGLSAPHTGSTGDGFTWLKRLGHNIIDTDFSLVPIAIKDKWLSRLAGVTLTDIKLAIVQNGKRQSSGKGKILFTHFGITGPTVLNMSSDVREFLKYGSVVLELDLVPTLDYSQLKTTLNELFINNSNKKVKNVLNQLTPTSVANIVLELVNIKGDTPCHSVTKTQKGQLIKFLKAVPMHVDKLLGEKKAIISSGGVDIDEIDFKTMRSKIVPNLYIIGDLLNIDRPSGGYSLQICWASGYVSGSNA